MGVWSVLSKAGTTVHKATQASHNFSKAMADATKAMKTADSKVARAMEKSLSEQMNRMVWTGAADTWAYNKIVVKPPIRESDQDQRSEARRWLDERVEEVRVLAWQKA